MNKTQNCTVRLRQWGQSQAKAAKAGEGKYWVTSWIGHFQYGTQTCNCDWPMFCLVLRTVIQIGDEVIFPIPQHVIHSVLVDAFLTGTAQDSVGQLSRVMPPLHLNVQALMSRHPEHLLTLKQESQNTQRDLNTMGNAPGGG